jgi:hypothetical protein
VADSFRLDGDRDDTRAAGYGHLVSILSISFGHSLRITLGFRF